MTALKGAWNSTRETKSEEKLLPSKEFGLER